MEPIARPGWYPDQQDPRHERFWNGQEWTPHTRSIDAPPSASADLRVWWRRVRAKVLGVGAALLLLVGMTSCELEQADGAQDTVGEQRGPGGDDAADPGERSRPERVKVPGVRLSGSGAAQQKLRRAGLGVRIVKQQSWQPAGTVLAQRVPAGTRVSPGRTVTLVVAVPMPMVVGVVGRAAEEGAAALTRAGFGVRIVKQVVTSGSNGVVLSQVPNGTQRARPGAVVTLTVSNLVKPLVQAPAPSNCTPGYSPCLPPASDYDCSGGSGDGPKYTGLVKVTGSDPYDLDADGDGVACES